MADVVPSPRPGHDWGPKELFAYNINIQFQDAATFFGVNLLPQPAIADEVLTTLDADDMTDDANYKFLRYMDLAMNPVPDLESGVVDFVVSMLTLLGYVPRTRMVRTRVDIPLTVCTERYFATTDVCVVDQDDTILLLIQENKWHKEETDPEAQLIADAIAAFQDNNRKRALPGQDPIDAKVMPGIILAGSSPIFYYKIPVTEHLAQAVALGRSPSTQTVVYAHSPALPRPGRRVSEGMKPLDNRRQILSCYEAFKQFVNW